MDSLVPYHNHKDYKIEEKDLIPNGEYVDIVPNYPAPEGTRVHYLNGSDYRMYVMLDGQWRLIGSATPVSGIAFENSADCVAAGGSTQATSYSIAGPDALLFVAIAGYSGDVPTSVTYDGIAMTLLDSTTVTSNTICYLYYLRSPSVGTHSINITMSGSHGDAAIAFSYSGAHQATQPDANTKSGPTTTTHYTQSVTSVTNNAWAVMAGIYASSLALTPDSGTVIRRTNGGLGLYVCDTAQAFSPAGSITLGLNSASQSFTGIIAAIKPA